MAAKLDVSIPKLNGANYATWSYQVRFYLTREKLYDIISSDLPAQRDEAWKTKDTEAQAAIVMLIDPTQFQYVKNQTTAKGMWDSLKDHYQPKTITNKLSLFRRIMDMNFNGGNMEEYLDSIVKICDDLRAIGANHMASDEMIKAYMLCKLPPEYDSIRNAIEMRDDAEISVEFVRVKLIEEWKMRQSRDFGSQSDTVMKASTSIPKCYYCDRPGHYKRDCNKLKRDKETKRGKSNGMKSNSKANVVKCSGDDGAAFVFSASNGKNVRDWIVDSAATKHMTCDRDFFVDIDPKHREPVTLADNSVKYSEGIGSGNITYTKDGKEVKFLVTNVLYVPKLSINLLSVRVLTKRGYKVTFMHDECHIYLDGECILTARVNSNLYAIENKIQLAAVSRCKSKDCIHVWHRKLGHRDIKSIKLLHDKNMANGLEMGDCNCSHTCEICLRGKFSRLPFQPSKSRALNIMDLVHTDVCGPMQTETPGKMKYYLTFIDDHSRYTVVKLLRHKSEVFDRIVEYVALMENQTGRRPKIIRNDNGGEYIGHRGIKYLATKGIKLQLTAPHTPQQNGRAERKNRTLTEMARCMLYDANLPNEFWGEAVLTATYIQNRVYSRTVGSTPYEQFHGRKPNLSHIRTFGQYAYAMVPKQRRRKLDEKSIKLRLVGYDDKAKAYRLADVETFKVTISRDVRFLELGETDPSDSSPKSNEIETEARVNMPYSHLMIDDDSDSEFYGYSDDDLEWDNTFDGDDESSNGSNGQVVLADGDVRRSTRSNIGVPPERLIASMAAVTAQREPRTVKNALESPEKASWLQAMKDELKSIEDNRTWDLVDLPAGRKAIGSKWVFKLKEENDGNAPKYKARLVARGFSQVYGFDYTDVYAPVAKNTTFRLLLSIAAKRKLNVRHYDAKTAFLNGQLSEEIYMKQPPGFIVPGQEEKVCRLKRSIYGLKQAARAWNEAIHKEIVNLNFRQNTSDPCLYTSDTGIFLLIYVDDILVIGSDTAVMDEVMDKLKTKFVIKNLGNISKYLGIEVQKDENGNFLISQSKYIMDIVKDAGLENAKPSKYPMDSGYFKLDHSIKLESNEEYRRIIGQLLFVSINSRPDISVCVSILGRKVSCPSQMDLNEAKRIIRYLKGTCDLKLRLSDNSKNQGLVGFADADWAEDNVDRKSNTGYLFHFNGGLICWTSKKQSLVTLSTAEAEYVALCEACKEVVWLRNMLKDLGEEQTVATMIFEDNQSCLKMVETGRVTARNKHIGTKFEYVKQLKDKGEVDLEYCPTDSMEADILTKPLSTEKITRLRTAIGLGRH